MITVEAIVNAAAQEFGVTVLDIKSSRRSAAIVRPRHVAMYLARHMTPRSLPEIGRVLGHRDHTTVMYAVKCVDQALADDPAFASRVAALRDRLCAQSAQDNRTGGDAAGREAAQCA